MYPYFWLAESAKDNEGQGKRRLGLGDLDGLHGALDFTGSAEDAVLLPSRVRLPRSQWGLSTIIRDAFVHLFLFSGQLHSVEDVDWADGNADPVGDADVKIYTHS